MAYKSKSGSESMVIRETQTENTFKCYIVYTRNAKIQKTENANTN